MPYTVDFLPAARRQLKKFPKQIQDRIRVRIRALANEPRPPGVEKMEG